jgi:hypothetical protein
MTARHAVSLTTAAFLTFLATSTAAAADLANGQLRFGLTRGGHVALNLGLELPLSDQSWDCRSHLNLLWDFADGSFFKGW